MPSPLILEITSNFPANIKKDIESLTTTLDYQPIWQTIEWQVMLSETRYTNKSFFIGAYEQTKLLSYALVEQRSIGLGYTGLFCIGGPVVSSTDSLSHLSSALQELAEKEKSVFVQIEPFSPLDMPGFKIGQYKGFIEKHTAVIDLTLSDETILAHMKPKGRYNIRVAEKAGVTVEQVNYSEENLDIFYDILSETLERDGFAANSKEYFRSLLQYLEKQNLGGLFFAKREGEVISAGIFVFYKNTALYYYGASSSDNMKRKYMASYLLQWKAIEVAKERGCAIFDFLGIAAPDDIDSHLSGVTDFKLKLTDNTREWPKTQVYINHRFIYTLLTISKKLKKLLSR